jgi:class 3 adenylate cyclase
MTTGDSKKLSLAAEIAGLQLFESVPSTLLDHVTPDMVQYFPDGDVLFHEGGAADNLILILHGQVCIVSDGMHLISRGPYAIIGEQAFINRTTRSATARAQGMVRALVIPREMAESLLVNAAFAQNLLRLVSAKLSESTAERAFRFRNEQALFTEFRSHVSATVANRLLATGKSYGDPRYIDGVILLSDIRSFSDLSACMSPEQIANDLSSYLDTTVEIIHRYEGLVDKFVGDAVLAIWGYAATETDLVWQAFSCAKEMVQCARSLTFGGKPISIGVGLNAGRVFMGNVGGDGKRQFTVLGTPVNLTARYEALTKELQEPIVMGEAFRERLPAEVQAQLTEHTKVMVKGAASQTVYGFGRESVVHVARARGE